MSCGPEQANREDFSIPSGTVLINNNDSTTNSTSVTININWAWSNEVYLTNIPGCDSGGQWFSATNPYVDSFSWTIQPESTNLATVFAKFRKDGEGLSLCTYDEIEFVSK